MLQLHWWMNVLSTVLPMTYPSVSLSRRGTVGNKIREVQIEQTLFLCNHFIITLFLPLKPSPPKPSRQSPTTYPHR